MKSPTEGTAMKPPTPKNRTVTSNHCFRKQFYEHEFMNTIPITQLGFKTARTTSSTIHDPITPRRFIPPGGRWRLPLAFCAVFLLLRVVTPDAFGSLEIPLSAQELSADSELIVVAEVTGQQATMREDQNGKHIYTAVTLNLLETLKGENISTNLELEVVGGTFEGWREEVSFSPTFTTGEQVVLFLKGKPHRLAGARQGKRTVVEGKFIIDGCRLKPKDFASALAKFNLEKANGKNLKAFISEVGETLRGSPAIRPANWGTPPSSPSPGLQTSPPNGPQDLGGGQLPPSETLKINK